MKGLRRWRFEIGGKKTQGSRLKAQSYKQEGWYAALNLPVHVGLWSSKRH
jgi:hypothetical protein